MDPATNFVQELSMLIVHLITLVTAITAAWNAIKGRQAAQDAHAAVNGGLDARIDGRVSRTLQRAQVRASAGQSPVPTSQTAVTPDHKG